MNNHEKSEFARKLVMEKLISLGAKNVIPIREGSAWYILAENSDGSRSVKMKVISRFKGDWQSKIYEGKQSEEKLDERYFWIFIDLSKPEPIHYFIVEEWWIRNNIYVVNKEYKNKPGRRVKNPDSTHHRIPLDRIEQWKNRWDLLKIF